LPFPGAPAEWICRWHSSCSRGLHATNGVCTTGCPCKKRMLARDAKLVRPAGTQSAAWYHTQVVWGLLYTAAAVKSPATGNFWPPAQRYRPRPAHVSPGPEAISLRADQPAPRTRVSSQQPGSARRAPATANVQPPQLRVVRCVPASSRCQRFGAVQHMTPNRQACICHPGDQWGFATTGRVCTAAEPVSSRACWPALTSPQLELRSGNWGCDWRR
jgi:hypothetical protein